MNFSASKPVRNWIISVALAVAFVFGAARGGIESLSVLLPGELPFMLLRTNIQSESWNLLADTVSYSINIAVWTILIHWAIFDLPAILVKHKNTE